MFTSPIVAAPMAGGSTTASLAIAARAAGAYPFLAGGYKTADALRAEIEDLRGGGDFGVNLFVPRGGPLPPAEVAALERYRDELRPTAARFGAEVPAESPAADDPKTLDYWPDKIDLLLAEPVPLASFTFGLAPGTVVRELHRVGTTVVVSVTSVAEAIAAQESGADALVVQHPHAGGHSAAFLPAGPGPGGESVVELVAAVCAAVALPLVGAGGIGDAATARKVLDAGAVAVQLGTALLRSEESGARQVHKDALADPDYARTALTRAFTGKPARGLVNEFMTRHGAGAPDAYPEVHFLTGPLRAAAAAASDPRALNLWAGTAWRQARTGPVAEIIQGFLADL